MVKFGYNCDSGSISFESLVASMRASGGDCHLLMVDNGGFFLKAGDYETIRKYCAAVPDCKFIIRLYHKLEGNWSQYPSALQYEANWKIAKQLLGNLTERLIFDSPFNEPNLAGDNAVEAKHFVDYCIRLVKAASNAGIKLAVGAFSVGTPHESLISTVYAPLWRKCDELGQGVSVHAYGAAIPELAEYTDLRDALDPKKARAAIRENKWNIGGGWLIARPFRIIEAYSELGLGTPQIYVTEGIVDNIFNSSNSDIKDEWRNKFGIDAFNRDPRGVQTWERWLLEVFKPDGFDFGQCLKFLFSHARRNIFYHKAFKAVCIFALNAQWGYGYGDKPNGTNKEAGSNFDRPEFEHFRTVDLPAINAESLEDNPMPQLYSASFHSLKVSNVRSANDVNSPILYTLDTNPLSGAITKEGETMQGSSFIGLAIEFEHPATQATVKGFIAKTTNLVIEYNPDVPAPKHYRLSMNGAEMFVSEMAWPETKKAIQLFAASLDTILPE